MSGRRMIRMGFTLIELLTVISIIVILLALTAIMFPNFQSQSTVSGGADVTAGALLSAKMRAKRDNRPTGVQLVLPSATGSVTQATQLQVIQQPDDYAVGRYIGFNGQTANFTGGATFTATDPSTGRQFVNPGDYLELNGGGLLYLITLVSSSTTLVVQDSTTYHPLQTATLDWGTGPLVANYRVIRAPQVLVAEPVINLPVGVIIDLQSYPNTTTTGTPGLSGGMSYQSGYYFILFAPNGSVVGVNSTSQIYLVLRQADGSNVTPYGSDLTAYFATIIAVEPRTGFIAAHPVAAGANPYAFTQDGQSSGM